MSVAAMIHPREQDHLSRAGEHLKEHALRLLLLYDRLLFKAQASQIAHEVLKSASLLECRIREIGGIGRSLIKSEYLCEFAFDWSLLVAILNNERGIDCNNSILALFQFRKITDILI